LTNIITYSIILYIINSEIFMSEYIPSPEVTGPQSIYTQVSELTNRISLLEASGAPREDVTPWIEKRAAAIVMPIHEIEQSNYESSYDVQTDLSYMEWDIKDVGDARKALMAGAPEDMTREELYKVYRQMIDEAHESYAQTNRAAYERALATGDSEEIDQAWDSIEGLVDWRNSDLDKIEYLLDSVTPDINLPPQLEPIEIPYEEYDVPTTTRRGRRAA
jgi:hypothetical protein